MPPVVEAECNDWARVAHTHSATQIQNDYKKNARGYRAARKLRLEKRA